MTKMTNKASTIIASVKSKLLLLSLIVHLHQLSGQDVTATFNFQQFLNYII